MKPGQGIPELTLAVLKRIERILEEGRGFAPVLPPIVQTEDDEVLDEETRWTRYGHFTAHHSPERRETLRLVWHPGTERIFPTFDQMVKAREIWTTALSWDMSEVVGDYHVFGIPLLFDSA